MRALLLIALVLPACTAARRTTISPEGAVEIVNGGQMGGRYTIVYTRSAKGAVKLAENIDNEKSLADVAQTAGIAYGTLQVRLGQEAETAADVAIQRGAQKAATAQGAQAADVAKKGIESATKIATTPALP